MLKANDFDRDGCRIFIVQFPCRKMKTFLFARIISEKIASSETLRQERMQGAATAANAAPRNG